MSDVEPDDSNTIPNSAAKDISLEPTTIVATEGDVNDSTMNDHTNSALFKGISSLLSSVIRDFDSRAESTLRSQDQLTFALDRLTRELDQLLEDAPLPFIMQHAAKLSGVRRRVSSLNSVLKSIQQRVDNIDRMLSAGSLHEKLSREGSGQH